ncbi:MAG TPA: hypothetical protein VIN11_05160 [Roseivirga sp.]
MKRSLILLFLVSLSVSAFAQKKTTSKPQAKDSTVYFYGVMQLSSGMNVVSAIDSVTAKAPEMEQVLLTINETNKSRMLAFAKNELGDRRLNFKGGKKISIIEIKPSKLELRTALDDFLRINKGSVYSLIDFTFVKPGSKEKIKVERYD